MLRIVISAAFGLLFSLSYGQLKKFYTLKETSGYDTVAFTLEATSGNCFVKSSATADNPLSIFGNPDLDKINPSFQSSINNNTCRVRLSLKEFRSSSLSDEIFYAMASEPSENNNYWKVIFDREKVYKMNLSYGFGNADVDLSGTSVSNFKVRSGSADILVDYDNGMPNQIEMDTFWIKADMGSIVAKHLELTRARYIMANIGFGRALLDFSNAMSSPCTVDASVGAGSLDIFLPASDTPMIIYLKDSPLCGTQMPHGFEQVESNVFVNMNYSSEAKNLLTFRVDVALGNVAFHGAD